MEPQTSITTEAGWQHQFNEDYVADLSIYYKKNFNYVSVQKRIDPNVNLLNYYQYISENYGSARGLDFNLQKMLSNYIVGSLSYSLGWAEGTDARVLDYKLQDTQTLREFPLDWDIRHSFGVNVAFEVQRDEYFYIPFTEIPIPIDDYNINVLYNYASGAPYTDSRAADYETNSKRKPATDVMHLKITKNFNLSQKSRISVYCSIHNLFDKKNVEFAYLKTGSPYVDGADLADPETGFVYEETQQIHNIFTRDPGNVSFGRAVIFGMSFSW